MLIHLARGAFTALVIAFSTTALADISILVRTEAGFDRMAIGVPLLLTQNASPVTLEPGLLDVSYVGDYLNIIFVDDYPGGSPFGVAAYRSYYTPAPADDPNSVAFVPIVDEFTMGTVLPIYIAPIPEPATASIIGVSLIGCVLLRILRKTRSQPIA